MAIGARVFVIAALLISGTQCHYFREDQPHSFAAGESVDLKVNKLTSTTTLLPVDYKSLPFCKPEGGWEADDDTNLGQYLAGDRIRSSPYRLKMKEDAFCEQLCVTDLGREQRGGVRPNEMSLAIRKNYHHNWIVDDLPAAGKLEGDTTAMTKYFGGFPLGFIASETGKVYIHNHVNIEIWYHNVETEPDRARIVRLVVEPFSIKHDFEPDESGDADEDGPIKAAGIRRPIESCDRKFRSKEHTRYEMIVARNREPQPASGRVLFTYDVIWKEDEWVDWPSRWHVYLTMDNAIPACIHWMSIANSLVVLFMTSGILAAILVRNLRRDFNHYKILATDEERAESIIGFAWKLVHANVFRPPSFSPSLLAACCGTGSQLLCTAFWTILSSALGFTNSSRRGSLLMALLGFYALNGLAAGYVSARFYKTFNGKGWRKVTAITAFGFPGMLFGLWLIVDIVALWQGSTYAASSRTIVASFSLWLSVSTALVILGAYLGWQRESIRVTVNTRSAPRQIPDQFMIMTTTLAAAACANFSICYVEICFILESVWMGQYYHTFGFLLMVLIILVLTCAVMTALCNFIQISGENYRWWWRSFSVGGSTGFGFFFSSLVFLRKHGRRGMPPLSFPSSVVYFGFMGLISLGLFLMTGFVGTSACLCFNKTMFSSIVSGRGHSPEPASDFSPSSNLDSRTVDNGSSTMKKALIAAFMLTALFSPVMFYPSHSGINSSYQNQWHDNQQMKLSSRMLPGNLRQRSGVKYRPTAVVRSEGSDVSEHKNGDGFILGEVEVKPITHRATREMSVSAKKVQERHTPYAYGLATLFPAYNAHGILEKAIAALLWGTIVVLSVVAKRRSARPGGRIYLYNQTKVHKIVCDRRRVLRDILRDPLLKEDTERRYGDLTSLLAIVAEWQSHGFHDIQKKNECVKSGKIIIVPWIRNMNVWLCCITYITFFSGFDEITSMMILPVTFVHVLDNVLLYRAAAARGASGTAESNGILAAVGIPVIDIAS